MDSEDTKVIVQFCFLVDASLKAVNDNYELKDGSAVFGDLAQANELKKSISKSYGRYLKSTNHDRDGVTRYGSRGNKIAFTPLPEDFDIGTKIYPKRGARGFKLPEWSTELYNNQFGRSTVSMLAARQSTTTTNSKMAVLSLVILRRQTSSKKPSAGPTVAI